MACRQGLYCGKRRIFLYVFCVNLRIYPTGNAQNENNEMKIIGGINDPCAVLCFIYPPS